MPPNMVPYRGLGLAALERGGEALQRALFKGLKKALQRKRQLPLPSFEEYPEGKGSSTEAARRLAHTCRLCFNFLNKHQIRSVLMPFIGLGVYGFEPKRAAHILVQAAIEEMLQVDAVSPLYSLSRIDLVDVDFRAAGVLAEAVREAESLWIPEKQVITAPQYWSRQSRRILEVSDSLLSYCKRHTRVSFKKHHGVIRRQKKHYFSNIRPFMWRASRVLQPPAFLVRFTPHTCVCSLCSLPVYREAIGGSLLSCLSPPVCTRMGLRVQAKSAVLKHSGAPAAQQLPARPFFLKGVSAILYPPRVSGFPSLRLRRDGQFTGTNKMPSVSEKAKPRL
ncbi:hypothetical protein cyc_08994 [Cyclospora cayetanensis]|uniref:Macro domain-containing protein n=1 Tax=Cyclospora cayetanensis TaxID=88456 RepID=A0A1D3D5M4_9EIME|nr:hypothetical protein cyc_08994 [Cyclospora cayetanensis]